MDHRNLLIAAIVAAGMTSYAAECAAETIAVDAGIAVKESSVAAPSRGMTMDQVTGKFGMPTTKVPAVGSPPISRWEYPGFIVYFEHEHVIHSVIANS